MKNIIIIRLKNQLWIGFTIVCMTVFVIRSKAQEILSFQDCLNLTLENDHQLNLNTIKVEQLDIQKELSQTERWIPHLRFIKNFGIQIGRTVDPTTNVFTAGSTRTQSMGFTSSFDIYEAGIYKSQNRIIDLEKKRLTYLNEARSKDLNLELFAKYTQALLSRKQLSIHQNSVDKIRKKNKLLAEELSLGIVSLSEFHLAEAQLSRYEKELDLAYEQFRLSLLELSELMNLELNDEIKLYDIEIEKSNLPQVLEANDWLNTVNLWDPKDKLFHIDEKIIDEQIIIEKKKQRPTIVINADLFSNYSSRVQEIDSYRFEEFSRAVLINEEPSIYKSIEQIPTFKNSTLIDQWKDNFGQNLSIQISYPFGNLFTKSKRIQLKRKQLEILKEEQKELNRNTNNQFYFLKNEQEMLNISITKLQQEINSLQKYCDIKIKSYVYGMTSNYDLYEVEQDLFELKLRLLNLKYESFFKRNLNYYLAYGVFPTFKYATN